MHRGGSQTQSIGIGTSGMLNIEGTDHLTISDRALLRKFKSLETARENFQQVGIYKQEVTTSVSRVVGHPLKSSLSLCDRALLRKYPDADSSLSSFSGAQSIEDSMLSCSPICGSFSSCCESKWRVRRRQRGILEREIRRKKTLEWTFEAICCTIRIKLALPTASSPRSQGLQFLHASLTSPSILNSGPPVFALLYFTLVKDQAVPMGYLQEFLSLEIPTRRAAKRSQISAASISDSMATTALSALRREGQQRAIEIGSIADQLVIAADLKPRKFRAKWQRAVYDGPTARTDAELARARTLGTTSC